MINKILKIVAAIVFIISLAVNVKITNNDPFVMMSLKAIATGTDTVSTGDATGTIDSCNVHLYHYECYDGFIDNVSRCLHVSDPEYEDYCDGKVDNP